jgi:hypothetical protein
MFGWPGRLCADQFQVEGDRYASRDFVLHGEQIARVAVEPLRPEVGRILGIAQLGADAELAAQSLNAPFQHIAHAQFTADLLRIDGFVPIGAALREITNI